MRSARQGADVGRSTSTVQRTSLVGYVLVGSLSIAGTLFVSDLMSPDEEGRGVVSEDAWSLDAETLDRITRMEALVNTLATSVDAVRSDLARLSTRPREPLGTAESLPTGSQLESLLSRLGRVVDDLESERDLRSAIPAPVPKDGAKVDRFLSLGQDRIASDVFGLTPRQVLELLGRPDEVVARSADGVYWIYPAQVACDGCLLTIEFSMGVAVDAHTR